jgi:predicted O-linked N-acetylglucosamine transferase (SPINDLY family)
MASTVEDAGIRTQDRPSDPLERARQLHDLAEVCAADPSRLSEAVAYSRKAHELAPTDAWLCAYHGRDLAFAGQVEEGIALMEKAALLGPDNACLQLNPLWFRHYVPGTDRQAFWRAYHAWGQRFAPRVLHRPVHANPPDPDRRIRVGYISPDLRAHSVASTFEPILDGHDRGQVEVFGYGSISQPDAVTERLKARFDRYRDILGQTSEAVAEQIHADQVDILVALAGHCTGNRIDVFVYEPAPVQVDLGSISTTGMPQVGYRITDAVLDPPETQPWYVEQLVHLPGGFVSYRPPPESPWVEPLPAQAHGFVTFGSFNNHVKINWTALELWSKILSRVPRSRIVLKFPAGADHELGEHYGRCFERHGVARDRISVVGVAPHFEHLRMLGQVDLALDTVPFNGCVTTLEGLWMGVPIVTLKGQTYVAQVGTDILTRLGLDFFVAHTPEEYVDKACAAASQWEALASLRRGLRGMMLASPLCDANRFTRELEQAYRQMWRRWCEGQAINRGKKLVNHVGFGENTG